MDAILPAAGLASRMRGLPKFLLPCEGSYETLIERHIKNLIGMVDRIWIPTRPQNAALLELLDIPSERVVLLSLSTETMSETILRVLQVSSAENFSLFMPDTYFLGELPYEEMCIPSELKLALWRIRPEQAGKLGQVKFDPVTKAIQDSQDKNPECDYVHSWGAMSFSRESSKFLDPRSPHSGYMINPAIRSGVEVTGTVMHGEYFDCGTPAEYFALAKRLG